MKINRKDPCRIVRKANSTLDSDSPLTHLCFLLRGVMKKVQVWEKGMQGLMFKEQENGLDPQMV